MIIIELAIPEYTVESEPDIDYISSKIDNELKKYFLNKSVVVRGVASTEHPDKSQAELIEIIEQNGTDRYDSDRQGDRYENIEGKHIDLFGVPAIVTNDSEISNTIICGFYHSAIAIHARPMKIDIVTIYDAEQMNQVLHRYEGRDDLKDDGFAFKYPGAKPKVLLGIIKIS